MELGLTTATVTIAKEGFSAPISVVKHAESLLKDDHDFEHVFLVFDRDGHSSYGAAITKANALRPRKAPKAQAIVAIPSIPCFEVWFLFHVSGQRKPHPTGKGGGSPAQELIHDLKISHACFAGYDKANCEPFYDEIKPMRDEACRRAERALKEASSEGQQRYQENPSTRAHLVVRKLQDMAKKQEEGS